MTQVRYFLMENSIEEDIYDTLTRTRESEAAVARDSEMGRVPGERSAAVGADGAAVAADAAVAVAAVGEGQSGAAVAEAPAGVSSALSALPLSPAVPTLPLIARGASFASSEPGGVSSSTELGSSQSSDEQDEPSTQQLQSRTEAAQCDDPEIQAVLLPSLCSCLRAELNQAGLALPPTMSEVDLVERACSLLGMEQPGPPADRARKCLAALGVA